MKLLEQQMTQIQEDGLALLYKNPILTAIMEVLFLMLFSAMVAKQNGSKTKYPNFYSNNRHLNTKNSRYSAVGGENFCLAVWLIPQFLLPFAFNSLFNKF